MPLTEKGDDRWLDEHPPIMGDFVDGTSYQYAGGPYGWKVDANTEYAAGSIQIPEICARVIALIVWGVGLAAPGAGNAMEIQLTAAAGQLDEPYNAEAIAVANKESDIQNFAINDVVSWTFTADDDPDIADLEGGDSLTYKVNHEAGVGGNIDTDAVIRNVELIYEID